MEKHRVRRHGGLDERGEIVWLGNFDDAVIHTHINITI